MTIASALKIKRTQPVPNLLFGIWIGRHFTTHILLHAIILTLANHRAAKYRERQDLIAVAGLDNPSKPVREM